MNLPFLIVSAVKIALVLVVLLTALAYTVWVERKVAGQQVFALRRIAQLRAGGQLRAGAELFAGRSAAAGQHAQSARHRAGAEWLLLWGDFEVECHSPVCPIRLLHDRGIRRDQPSPL